MVEIKKEKREEGANNPDQGHNREHRPADLHQELYQYSARQPLFLRKTDKAVPRPHESM